MDSLGSFVARLPASLHQPGDSTLGVYVVAVDLAGPAWGEMCDGHGCGGILFALRGFLSAKCCRADEGKNKYGAGEVILCLSRPGAWCPAADSRHCLADVMERSVGVDEAANSLQRMNFNQPRWPSWP